MTIKRVTEKNIEERKRCLFKNLRIANKNRPDFLNPYYFINENMTEIQATSGYMGFLFKDNTFNFEKINNNHFSLKQFFEKNDYGKIEIDFKRLTDYIKTEKAKARECKIKIDVILVKIKNQYFNAEYLRDFLKIMNENVIYLNKNFKKPLYCENENEKIKGVMMGLNMKSEPTNCLIFE